MNSHAWKSPSINFEADKLAILRTLVNEKLTSILETLMTN